MLTSGTGKKNVHQLLGLPKRIESSDQKKMCLEILYSSDFYFF